jgi:hypothetical protein
MDVAGSSVAAMVVGTVFIMIFGMATVSLVENIDQSIKNADYELPNPEVDLVSVTDKPETTGPVSSISFAGAIDQGTGYTGLDGTTCPVSGGSGTGMSVTISVVDDNVSGATISSVGSGYTVGNVLAVNCSGGPSGDSGHNANVSVTAIHDKNTIIIRNVGSETVELANIILTLSDTSTPAPQGTPFNFTAVYSGGNTFLFPGEQISSDSFILEPSIHGFNLEDDPNRAFLAIFDYSSSISIDVT